MLASQHRQSLSRRSARENKSVRPSQGMHCLFSQGSTAIQQHLLAANAARWAACLTRVAKPYLLQRNRNIHTSLAASVSPAMEVPAALQQEELAQQTRPRFHIQPKDQGWINDPNGVHYDPKTKLYHMFWQHFGTGSVWSWGLSWGHACSKDLINWHYLPPALSPTPNSPDQDGVWSGCAFPTDQGTVILNTAVKLRANTPSHLLPPAELDIGQQMIESQAYAIADNRTDPLLRSWTKGSKPLLELPPQGGLTGWRDPFLLGRPGDGVHDRWTMMIGSGYTQPHAGTAFVYTSDHPTHGWEYQGELCRGDGTTGGVWECPLLAHIPLRHVDRSAAQSTRPSMCADKSSQEHMLVVCPDNAHHSPVYQLGHYDPRDVKFSLETATRTAPLDLGGPTFYAPNLLTNDPQGRIIMWGWCQELGRPEGDHNFACCLSQPRLLWRHPHHEGRVWQEPLPSLTELRIPGAGWSSNGPLELQPGAPLSLPGSTAHAHVELMVRMSRPEGRKRGRVCKTAVMLPAVEGVAPQGEASGRHGSALVYDWNAGRLDVVYSDGSIPVDDLARLPTARYAAINKRSTVTVAGSTIAQPHNESLEIEDEEEMEDHMAELARSALNISGCHAVGGVLHHARRHVSSKDLDEISLRIFFDGSLMEVFTSTGEVLTARVYREVDGVTLPVQLASFGATARVEACEVHVMDSHWQPEEALSSLEQQLTSKSSRAAGLETVMSPRRCLVNKGEMGDFTFERESAMGLA